MRILLDECVPRKLGWHLVGYTWSTVPREGLAGVKNGELFTAIQGKWEVLFTTDANIPWQQVVAKYDLGVVIVRARSNDIADLPPWVPQILKTLEQSKPGESREAGDPDLIGE